eukprot:TRINITY_DN2709_c0_g2_i1.p1 TRINITY_DN2709_c0_g2~~TRINITY_DN2709_c0_g2_i1.p1  ORF type:complete len:328 (-),score=81.74 TRINITY_DN2709_c0_g2_i1:88-1071(-)
MEIGNYPQSPSQTNDRQFSSPRVQSLSASSSPKSHTVRPPFGTELSYDSPSPGRNSESIRNPITEGDEFSIRRGKKLVPEFLEDMAGLSSSPRHGHGKGRPAAVIDRSRAGLPTDLRRARVRDGDLFILRSRPNSAPASTLSSSPNSFFFKDPNTPAGVTPPQRVRKVKEVPGSVIIRNPLVDNEQPSRQSTQPPKFSVTRESSTELWDTKKTPRRLISHKKSQPVAEQGIVPGQDPGPLHVKISAFMPDDNKDVFEYKHSQGISPATSQLYKEREIQKDSYEQSLRKSQVEQMEFYRQAKERMVQRNPALKESLFPTKKLSGSQTP